VHRVVRDGEPAEVGADEVAGRVGVGAHEVDSRDLAALGLGEEVGLREAVDHVLGHVGERRRAVVRDELHAVVLGRVVRGGDHAGAGEPAVDNGVRDHGRRRVALGEDDVEAVAGDHLGEALGEPLRGLAGVVADRDRALAARRVEVVGDRLSDDPHALVGERVERRPPAVRAEGDLVHRANVGGRDNNARCRSRALRGLGDGRENRTAESGAARGRERRPNGPVIRAR
jgi:hypothetical protein